MIIRSEDEGSPVAVLERELDLRLKALERRIERLESRQGAGNDQHLGG